MSLNEQHHTRLAKDKTRIRENPYNKCSRAMDDENNNIIKKKFTKKKPLWVKFR